MKKTIASDLEDRNETPSKVTNCTQCRATNCKAHKARIITKTTDGYYLIENFEAKIDFRGNTAFIPIGIYTLDTSGEEYDWFLCQDDALDLRGDFEYHVENLREEMRCLMADARSEFGF